MREIKFRGKSVKNGDWVYGYLFPRSLLEDPDYLSPLWIATGFENEHAPVDEETIGQFTGLRDRNGKEIYHRDICLIRFDLDKVEDSVLLTLTENEKKTGKRIFIVESPLFNRQIEFTADDIEVIGNIHENPELLNA